MGVGYNLNFLNFLKTYIDNINKAVGVLIAWLTLFMVVITALVVMLRYGFSIGFIWMQESVRFMYAAVFLLCAGYTLLEDKHVRVDVFYLKMSERKKAIVDILGTMFLLWPVCFVILYFSWNYVLNSWVLLEGSLEERGLHLVYVMKTFIWCFSILLIIQGISNIIKSLNLILKK